VSALDGGTTKKCAEGKQRGRGEIGKTVGEILPANEGLALVTGKKNCRRGVKDKSKNVYCCEFGSGQKKVKKKDIGARARGGEWTRQLGDGYTPGGSGG